MSRQDATRPGQEARRVIGTVRDKRLLADPALLFAFLLEAQIIETYWHVEARLVLAAFEDSAASAGASFDGTHIYFTNSRNEEQYAFVLKLDKKTGIMSLE